MIDRIGHLHNIMALNNRTRGMHVQLKVTALIAQYDTDLHKL